MSEFTLDQLDNVIAALEHLESDVSETINALHTAGFSEEEQPPATQ